MFLRKSVLKICSKFTGEHPCRSVISIKLQFYWNCIFMGRRCGKSIKKICNHFSNFCKYFLIFCNHFSKFSTQFLNFCLCTHFFIFRKHFLNFYVCTFFCEHFLNFCICESFLWRNSRSKYNLRYSFHGGEWNRWNNKILVSYKY